MPVNAIKEYLQVNQLLVIIHVQLIEVVLVVIAKELLLLEGHILLEAQYLMGKLQNALLNKLFLFQEIHM